MELKQAVERFNEAIGLSGSRPIGDVFIVSSDHFGDRLNGLDIGSVNVDAPSAEHGLHDVDLLPT